ncbi:ASCH domain-containing protein [Sulfitobacter sp. SK012]|uniref:ASCH domain-containing protein n=1 Tax=Sulfitobacter sp. SK012 TaxID=1389005 RepID=UPI0026D57671
MTSNRDDFEDLQDTYPGAGTFMFGDSAEVSQIMIASVRAGKKSATCCALSDFDDAPEAMPVVGRCDIAANWDGTPALVIRTVKVEQVRFCDVTWAMAMVESEDDTIAEWKTNHQSYFERNGGFDSEMMLVFEHFELVEDLDGRGV